MHISRMKNYCKIFIIETHNLIHTISHSLWTDQHPHALVWEGKHVCTIQFSYSFLKLEINNNNILSK